VLCFKKPHTPHFPDADNLFFPPPSWITKPAPNRAYIFIEINRWNRIFTLSGVNLCTFQLCEEHESNHPLSYFTYFFLIAPLMSVSTPLRGHSLASHTKPMNLFSLPTQEVNAFLSCGSFLSVGPSLGFKPVELSYVWSRPYTQAHLRIIPRGLPLLVTPC